MHTATPCPNAPSNADLSAAIADHSDRLHALALRMLRDHHAAQDAVQDACLRAFRALDRYRGDASLGTWLYRITANVCLDELRRRARVTIEPASEKGDDWLVEDDFSPTVVARAELADALSALPTDLRSAIMLTDGMGFSYIDAGAMLGVPVGTVASRVHRAKRTVRTALRAAA